MGASHAPKNLSPGAYQFWHHVVAEYDPEPDELVILRELVRAIDECDRLRAALDEHGMMIRGSTGQLVVNPAQNALNTGRNTVEKLLTRLGLHDEEQSAGERAISEDARKAAQERWRNASGRRAS